MLVTFEDLLINCEVVLDLSRTKDCVLVQHNNNIAGINFMITSFKIFVLAVTLSMNGSTKFLEHLMQSFKRKISWNVYNSEITMQRKNNNLDCLIDPTISNINRLFVQLFKVGKKGPKRRSFVKYYIPLA